MYTGNSATLGSIGVVAAVYPCVYRELTNDVKNFVDNAGLSLCIQGTLAHHAEWYQENRFIPVYTGNSLNVAICFI